MDYDTWKTTNPNDKFDADCSMCGEPCESSMTVNDCPVCESCHEDCDPRNEYNPDDRFDD